MEKANCEKCGKYGWVHNHHILPKSDFGGEGDIVKLCPNCHADYHKKLGKKNLKGNSMEFHFEKFYRWLSGLSIILAIALMLSHFLA